MTPANDNESPSELSLLARLRIALSSDNILSRVALVTAFATIIGSLAAAGALLYIEAVDYLNDLLLISARSRMMAVDRTRLMALTIAVPAIGGLTVGLIVHFLIRGASPEGPPELIRATQARKGLMRVGAGFWSTTASLISLGAGASLGQYGPLAHLGGLLGSVVARLTGSIRSMGTIGVGCGVAAAISAAFNAPIAGVVFAHEVVLRHTSLRAFAPITMASTMAYFITNIVFKSPPLFRIEDVSVNRGLEFLFFVIIGAGGAVVAVALMRALIVSQRWASRTPLPNWIKPALAGALLGCVAISIPEVLGISAETLRFAVIQDAFSDYELIKLIVAKALVTALCLGFGFIGGVFSPALVIGILFGALMGSGAELILPGQRSDLAIYAICGMVAVASPIIGAPLTSILIVFELTRNYELTTAVMVSAVFANIFAYRMFGRSWFDVQLRNEGFDLSLGRDRVVLEEQNISSLVSKNFVQIDPFDTVEDTLSKLVNEKRTTGYIVDDDGNYTGSVTVSQILSQMNDTQESVGLIGDLADRDSLILTIEDSIWESMERIGGFVGESIPVIESNESDRMAGIINESAIVRAYLDAVYEIRREENAAG